MYCLHCGRALPAGATVCPVCGCLPDGLAAGDAANPSGRVNSCGSVGYSSRINDPALSSYFNTSNRWAAIFSLILAAIALVGFSLAGALPGSGIQNPKALLIGLVVGGMLVATAFVQMQSYNCSRTWDGRVADKRIEIRYGRRPIREGPAMDSRLYTVVILSDRGRKHFIQSQDDGTRYDYFAIGDRVRYHGGLNSYEKFDKSHDSIIFCNACGALQPITADYCSRCKCPLLK